MVRVWDVHTRSGLLYCSIAKKLEIHSGWKVCGIFMTEATVVLTEVLRAGANWLSWCHISSLRVRVLCSLMGENTAASLAVFKSMCFNAFLHEIRSMEMAKIENKIKKCLILHKNDFTIT